MHRILFLFLIISSLNAQNIFFNDPVISGTPLIPSNDAFLKYFEELKKTDYYAFEKLTSSSVLPDSVGAEHDFNVANLKDSNSPKLDKKTFVLKVVSDDVNIWVEKAELENNHVTDAIITTIFNGLIYNTPSGSINPQKGIFEIDTEVYGSPPDIDSNGKVEFLLTDVVDGWESSDESFIGGFFYPNDQNVTFPGSNKADILYVDTYPGIYRDSGSDTYRALGTVAHELQHLIHYNYDKNESRWVNEGLSELASYLCGHGLRSPGNYLENTTVSMVSWNDGVLHYSRVALWTYYVYEKFGLSFIKELAQSSQSNISGFNAALASEGLSMTFDDVLSDFFKTLISNTPEQNAEYAFDLPELQYLKIVPNLRLTQYPVNREIVVNSYAMHSVEFTNGDSLVVHFEDPFKFPVYINKTGFGELSLLNEYNSEYIFDDNFGKNHHTQDLFFVNISNSSDVVRFKSDSYTKYDIAELKYDSGSPTYNIASYSSNQQGTTNAIQYVSPSDTAILKSIKFYNQSVLTDIRIHLYQSDLSSGGNPSSSFFDVKNVTLNEWVSIDTEDFLFTRDAGENFNVGIEFLTDAAGRMGYQSLSGKDHTDKSFVKGLVSSNNFFNLNQFQIGGETLDGTWMIRLELATPYTAKSIQGDSRIKSLSAYPIPFSPLHNSGFLNIEYELDNFGPVHLKIYNVLGQLVSSDFDRLGIGRFYWDGKNRSGQYVASGFYVLQLSSNKSNKYKRLLLLR